MIEQYPEFVGRTEFTEIFDANTRGGLLQPSGDARKARGLKIPEGPTPQEREEHEISHEPYRAWCPACVAGRGRSDAHRERDHHEDALATVAFDYGYFGDCVDCVSYLFYL